MSNMDAVPNGLKYHTGTTSGTSYEAIAASTGWRYVIYKVTLQDTSGTATTVTLKNGSTAFWTLRTNGDGTGVAQDWDCPVWLDADTAFNLTLSGSNAHLVNVQYRKVPA